LFERMKNMDNGPQRQAIIDQMVAIAREDAPWVWGFHPLDYSLAHAWLSNVKPNQMARNGLKYYRIDPRERALKRSKWNRPVVLPLAVILLLVLLSALPAIVAYRRRERAAARPARQSG